MKQFLTLFVLISVSLLGFASSSYALSASFDQKISVNNNPVADMHVTTEENNLRVESEFQGVKMITFRNADGIFNYYPDQKFAAKIPDDKTRSTFIEDLPDYMAYLKKNNAQKIGSEKVNQYDTDIYQFVEPNSKSDTKVWLWKERSFPVRIEMNAPEGHTMVELTNLTLDQKADPAIFKLPENTRIVDSNALLAASQEAQQKALSQQGTEALPQEPEPQQ
jgi:hypothetical protein